MAEHQEKPLNEYVLRGPKVWIYKEAKMLTAVI